MGERDHSFFDVLVREAPVLAWIKDARGSYVYVNPAWGSIFESTLSNVLGKTDVELWPEENARVIVDNDDLVRSSGQILEVKESATTPDGRLHKFLSIKFPARDRMVAGVAIEMTERWPEVADRDIAEARAKLKASREMIEAIHRAQSRFIARCDASVTFEGLLDILLALTHSANGLAGELVTGEDGAPSLHLLAAIPENWSARELCERVMREKRAVSTAEALGVPLFTGAELVGVLAIAGREGGYDEDSNRELQAFLSTCANLVEAYRNERRRTETEHALREREAELRAVLDHATDGIFISDPSGVLLDVNPAAAEIFLMTREQLIGLPIYKLVAPDQLPRLQATLREIDAGKPLFEEWRFARSDGSEAIGEVHASVMPNGRRLALVRDITERRRTERARERAETALRHSQKMAAIGTLAGGIAHDFNNLLAIIHGNASFVQDSLSSKHEMNEALADLLIASRRARDLIKRILTFSRQGESSMQRLNVRVAVEEALHLMRATLPAEVELTSELAEHLPPVTGDATQLHQVILNLVTNAWQALEGRSGAVKVSLSRAELIDHFHPDLRAGPHVVLRVTDTGSGISPANLPRIFEPFFTTKELGGTGLGLSVVHGVVRSHHGAITVDCDRPPGTTFTVYLPALPDSEAPPEQACAVLVRRGEGQRVLVIDDEPALLASMSRQLLQLNYRPSAFSDPREAVALFCLDPNGFELVLTDHSMPRMSGIEVAQAVHERLPDLPIILASGLLSDEEIAAARRAGVSEILAKPSSIDELGNALAAQLPKQS